MLRGGKVTAGTAKGHGILSNSSYTGNKALQYNAYFVVELAFT